MAYLVSDLITHRHGVECVPYWRVTGMFNSIVLAKNWVGSSTQSIITEHTLEEADAIYQTRVLPDVSGVKVAA